MKSFLLFLLAIFLANCDDIRALQCRQCISFSGDTITDCVDLPRSVVQKKEPMQPSTELEPPMDYEEVPVVKEKTENENSRAPADNVDGETSPQDTNPAEFVESSTSSIDPDNVEMMVDTTTTTPFHLCSKTSFYLRRGNHVARIIILDGLLAHNKKSVNETTSSEDELTSSEEHGLKKGSDGTCRYINGQNPILTQMAEILQLEPLAYLVGAKKCFCATNFCNGDPLMR